jgi:hypothetical protein
MGNGASVSPDSTACRDGTCKACGRGEASHPVKEGSARMVQQVGRMSNGVALHSGHGCRKEALRQLALPLRGDDVTDLLQARAEIAQLRFLLSQSNVHDDFVVEDAAAGEAHCETVSVPVPAPTRHPMLEWESNRARVTSLGDEPEAASQPELVPGPVPQPTPTRVLVHGAAAGVAGGDGKYVDASFPPGRQSLSRDWSALDAPKQERWGKLAWRRLSSIARVALFDQGIAPGDIFQGELGDCYMLSALCVLAERPERIKKLFVEKAGAPAGQFTMQLFLHGRWGSITVDDYVPWSEEGDRPAFSQPKAQAEMWVPLLEKAWAKSMGGYFAIEGGDPGAMLTTLTGFPSSYYELSDPNTAWAALMQAQRSGWVMCCSSPGNAAQDKGLVPSHCYSILAVYELPDRTRLLRIRNPWGRFEWNGDWSDSSPLWTDQLRRLVGWDGRPSDDGVFHMAMPDLARYYAQVYVCCVEDSYVRASTAPARFCVPGAAQPAPAAAGSNVLSPFRRACVRLAVPRAMPLSIELYQMSSGGSSGGLAAIRFNVVSLGPQGPTAVCASQYMISESVSVSVPTVAAGEYLVFISAGQGVTSSSQFVLSTSGPSLPTLTPVLSGDDASTARQPGGAWARTSDAVVEGYRRWTRETGQKWTFPEQPKAALFSWSQQQDMVACFFYRNDASLTLVESITFLSETMDISYVQGAARDTNEKRKINVTLKPGDTAFIVLEAVGSSGYSYDYRRSFKFQEQGEEKKKQ